ncbi:MAG TPA: hypothetical protein VIW70_09875, partial [Rubrivivax sp.]
MSATPAHFAVNAAPMTETRPPPGPWRSFWIHFSANAGAVAGLVIVVTVLLLAAF